MLRHVDTEPAPARERSRSSWRRRAPASDRLPVLLVVHQHHSSPGHVGRLLAERGHRLDIRRARYGDPLPPTLENHAGAVIFGGPMSANDTDDYVRAEIDWLEVPLAEDKPFLGICLGAQMLAVHLGGRVGFHPDGYSEIGYHPIRPTPAGRSLFRWPERVYQWHREGFTVPSGAELLARGERFENQAFRFGRSAYGIQLHPEISQALVHRWTARSAYRLVMPGAEPRAAHVDGHVRYGPAQRRWLADFLAHWLGGAAADADPAETAGR